MHHPTDRIAHTMAFVTPVVEHWLVSEVVHMIIINLEILASIKSQAKLDQNTDGTIYIHTHTDTYTDTEREIQKERLYVCIHILYRN